MNGEEEVLVIDRKNIPHAWLDELVAEKVTTSELQKLLPFVEWKDRKIAENDESVKQIIPYLIIESDIDGKIAFYQRRGSEKRIHGLYSVGVGGHVNPIDFIYRDSFLKGILRSARRELFEEFKDINPYDKINFLGIINEEKTKVGRTHLGLVFKLKVKGKPKPAEELYKLDWEYKKNIELNYDMEMWSNMALDLDIDIKDFFGDLTLTHDQEKVIDELEEFLFSERQIFILKGYAGTGKTTILKGVTDYLDAINRLGGIMAPTGRAAKIIKDKTKKEASTIHSFIYDLENIKTEKYVDKDGNETFKFYFDFPTDVIDVNKVLLFDEASMISNVFSEGEFFRFGSGYLLEDILKFFNTKNTSNIKLIFVGDPAQLPPVGSTKSKALDLAFFAEKELEATEVEMTNVVRQNKDSGILANAEYYRKLIFSDVVSENYLDVDHSDVEEIDVMQLKEKFVDIAPLPDVSKAIIITFSNKSAYTYNKIIREEYFPDYDHIQPGEILQVIKNSYSSELLNGEFVKVLEVDDNVEYQSAKIKKKGGKDILIKHTFRNVKIQHSSGSIIDVKILDNLLNSKNRELTSDETKALYINFIMRYEKRIGGRANKASREFKEAFKNDPYYNALQVKYGYAITGHKSQGGEWENVFVDFTGRVGTHVDALRWSYTAITRASKKLYVLYPPKLKQVDFSKIDNVAIGKIKKAPKGAIKYPEVDSTPYHSTNSNPAKRIKFFYVKEVLEKEGYDISTVISRDYLERYCINAENRTITIDMYNDAEGIFTQYHCANNDDLSNRLIQLLSKPCPLPIDFHYNTDDLLLNKIYQNMLSAMQGVDIQLTNIDDSKKLDFHVTYYFRTKAPIAYLQIFFNKKEIVSSIIAKSMFGEDDTELRKFIENLKK
jgi:predicted NUDIX family phosphoesterase